MTNYTLTLLVTYFYQSGQYSLKNDKTITNVTIPRWIPIAPLIASSLLPWLQVISVLWWPSADLPPGYNGSRPLLAAALGTSNNTQQGCPCLKDEEYQQNALSNKISQKSPLPVQNYYPHCRRKTSAWHREGKLRLPGQTCTSPDAEGVPKSFSSERYQ